MSSFLQASSYNDVSIQKLDPQTAIRKAAKETGADFSYLLKTAKRESGMDPTAKASTSSATGLFQFTDDTWLRMVERYGAKYGLDDAANAISLNSGKVSVSDSATKLSILALREDPVTASRMAGELANENAVMLRKGIGREPNSKELYIAHFMGPSGAIKLINAAESGSSQRADELFPMAAKANRAIFNDRNGQARSVSAVYAELTGSRIPENAAIPSAVSTTEALYQDTFGKSPVPPTSSLNIGVQLSTSMVMALLDLQDRHFQNTEKQRDDYQNVNKTSIS